jgi:Zn-dependent protease
MNGVPLARLFGIEIRLHLSWIFIIAIITVTVGGRLGQLQPAADATLAWLIGAIASLGFLATVVAHELAHALVGRRNGLPVESISVHFIGSPAAVDVRAATPRGEATAALAGPLTSLGFGLLLIGLAVLGILSGVEALRIVGDVVFIIGVLDLVLAGVSIVPAFPLDGGRVVRAIVWARTGDERQGARAAGTVGRWVGWVLIGAGLVIILTGGTVDGAMVGLIGWFLGASARSVDRWLLLDGLIAGVLVGEAMEAKLETITPQLTLDTFAAHVLDGTLGPALPVVRDEILVGIVGALQLRGVPRRDWPSTRTSDVMVDVADLPLVGPEESLADGLERLRTSRLDGLPVRDGALLRGVLTRRSVAVALRARADVTGVTL